ncbi:MAG TPA: divergent PAP2 family protein [Oscillatoriales cyanobacterium M59_W2019_021]|nr:MAG: divergent PAP2 family protein [Cyanobacteria bacterium J055]HIK32275.1 divergent PAP2 family protein [Oscillatoriales cyanobacterium M4454_W2019_049]HIK49883.1 divergent PAP2 family protein [Oscillatoriales cyanobacterium M59_W2019_021]
MQELSRVFENQVLVIALLACGIAQASKLVIHFAQHQKINFRVLVETGGMPSSHSALVAALATGVGQLRGWDSIEFAIASVFAAIVMYDAAGVRQAAGKQARILNQIIDELFQEGQEFNEDRLKELLGHTPFQVLVGLGLGIATSFLILPWF